MKFFYGCINADEAKKIYRKLAKVFHPDHSGDTSLMIELQKQYEAWDEPIVAEQPKTYRPDNFGVYPNGFGGHFTRVNDNWQDKMVSAMSDVAQKLKIQELENDVKTYFNSYKEYESKYRKSLSEINSLKSFNKELTDKNNETHIAFMQALADIKVLQIENEELKKEKENRGCLKTLKDFLGVGK